MRIAILSNVNLDMLIQDVNKSNTVFRTEGYGQWIPYCLENKGKLYDFQPKCIFLILDGNALLEECSSERDGKELLSEMKNYVCSLADNYQNSFIAVSTIDVKPLQKAGNERDVAVKWEYFWENCIQDLVMEKTNLKRFELKQLISDDGRKDFYSDKLWYTGSIPYSINAIKHLAARINVYLAKLEEKRKKVLLVDLDDTIWGGVLGEEGSKGIVLGNSNMGAVYRNVQKRILSLQKKGVLLAIVSKNNAEEVHEVFKQNKQMVLQEEDFVSIYANWENKSENIVKIAKELNLGLNSFVFLDNSLVEQEEVKINLPEVEVIPFPTDICLLPKLIDEIYETYFWCWHVTGEDEERTSQYHSEILRRKEQESTVSMENFLKSLDAKIELRDMDDEDFQRTFQLINKTNQFNTCTVRMDEIELEEYRKDTAKRVIVADISDKYGKNGLVAVLLLSYDDKTAHIDNFLMSCRVMGRKFENAIMRSVLEMLEQEGIKEITAEYIGTSRNRPVAQLWDKLNFKVVQKNNNMKSYKIVPQDREKNMLHEVNWK